MLIDFDDSVVQLHDVMTASGRSTDVPHGRSIRQNAYALARRFVRPRNIVAATNVRRLLSLLSEDDAVVLIVGGGTIGNGVDELYHDQGPRILAFDVYGSRHTQFVADAHRIPLADGSVNAVVVQAVLEHVVDPRRVVDEVRRVLKPAGVVYAETPFLQQVHAGPYDFTRFTSSGHRYLFRDFDEIVSGPVAGPGTALLWSIEHAVRGLFRSATAGKLAKAAFFWLRYLDRAIPERYAMDSASAYFFLGRRASHSLTPSDAVEYYRGAQQHALGLQHHL